MQYTYFYKGLGSDLTGTVCYKNIFLVLVVLNVCYLLRKVKLFMFNFISVNLPGV